MHTYTEIDAACQGKTVADIIRLADSSTLYARLVRIAEDAGLELTDRADVLPLYCSYRLSDSARQRLADEVTRLSKRWRGLGGLTVDTSAFPHWESIVCDCIHNGNQPHVEISCYDSVSGHTELIAFDYEDFIFC